MGEGVLRLIGTVAAGLLFFVVAEFLLGALARALWPEYAGAAASGAFTTSMLGSRLAAGAIATTCAGATTSMISNAARPAALWLGVTLLVTSILWHYQIWDKYPVWYHLTWFASIVPAALLGGRLVNRSITAQQL